MAIQVVPILQQAFSTCFLVHTYESICLEVQFLDMTTCNFTSYCSIALQSTGPTSSEGSSGIEHICANTGTADGSFCSSGRYEWHYQWHSTIILICVSVINSESKHLSVFLLTFSHSSSTN